MKRTIIERVAIYLAARYGWGTGNKPTPFWNREARRIIAMVHRHDARKAGRR